MVLHCHVMHAIYAILLALHPVLLVGCQWTIACHCRHPKAWWGAEPWKLLSELCTPGLCMVDAPAAFPESALATQPASKQPVTTALSAQQNLVTQLKPQEDTQQVGNETIRTCKLQVRLHLLLNIF